MYYSVCAKEMESVKTCEIILLSYSCKMEQFLFS